MNRRKLGLAAGPIVAAALLGLLAAGCGGSQAAGGAAATSTTSAQDAALEWARCMRKNGVDVDDPKVDSEGRVQIRVRGPGAAGVKPGQGSPADRKAFEACRSIMQKALPNGGRLTAAQRAEFQDAALKFAQCMRSHGVDMPDPTFGSGPGGGAFLRLRGKINPNDPNFRKAQEACRHLMPRRPGADR
jgi:hypothetical protein